MILIIINQTNAKLKMHCNSKNRRIILIILNLERLLNLIDNQLIHCYINIDKEINDYRLKVLNQKQQTKIGESQ